MPLRREGQGAEMVEVAVGEEDAIEPGVSKLFQGGQGVAARPFGMEARVDKKVERTQLKKQGVGSDFSVPVEVNKFHDVRIEATGSGGFCYQNE